MVKEYTFREAAPLVDFIDRYRENIVGRAIRRFYSCDFFGGASGEPMAFEFDDFVLVLHYFFYSDLRLHTVTDLFHTPFAFSLKRDAHVFSSNFCLSAVLCDGDLLEFISYFAPEEELLRLKGNAVASFAVGISESWTPFVIAVEKQT